MSFESVFTIFPALAEAAASFPCSDGAAETVVVVNDRAAAVAVAVVVIVAVIVG